MRVKLQKKYLFTLFSFYILLCFYGNTDLLGQNCNQSLDFNFEAKGTGRGINWQQFPEFSLPFKVVFGGNDYLAPKDVMLKRGFTHFSNPNYLPNLPTKNRAFIYYAPAGPEVYQPWSVSKSPYGNDIPAYEKYWATQVDRIKNETNNKDFIDADILVFDIEKQIKSEDSILLVKNLNSTPAEAKALSNTAFIADYKKKLQEMYVRVMEYTFINGKPNSRFISNYSDTPILNTFVNIQGKSWDNWKKDISSVNFLTQDLDKKIVGGKVYDLQNLMTPSAYFYYDYPHPFAGEYLSYMLFQCEANRAWTNKELMLFIWMKYSYNPDFIHKKIRPWMAESYGIFPFFAGVKGLWMWEQTGIIKPEEDLSNYEYFVKGLYRISKFKDMWEGDFKLIETISARDYNENKLPIWRGVLKGDKLLIAAQNTYAKSETEKVKINVSYGSFNKEIELTGYEIFMCKYDYNLSLGLEDIIQIAKYEVFPNPSDGAFSVKVHLSEATTAKIEIFDLNGKLLQERYIKSKVIEINERFELLAETEVIVVVNTEKERRSKKIILF